MLAPALTIALLVFAPRAAHADGAFPDSFAPLLPRTRPHEVLLATNFGLLSSADDGASWSYACEVPETALGRLYTLGAPAAERIYAVATPGLVATADGGCRWTVGGGALAGAVVLDDFPDPHEDAHVLAIAAAAGARDLALFESRDAGVTFTGPLFVPPASAVLTGVEIAAAVPATVYLSFYETPGIRPRLARSTDGGASWNITDLEPALGAAVPFLAAVDPLDAGVVYLRVSSRRSNEDASEALAITRDAGASWSVPLTLRGGTLTSFFRRASGTLLVTGTVAGAAIAQRSLDGGASFALWPVAIHPRGFGERDGLLYAATDNLADGFALATSADGEVWTPLMRFQDIGAVRACVRAVCLSDCRSRADLRLFSEAICIAGDAGIPTLPARATAAPAGCACGVGRVAERQTGGALLALLVLSLVSRLRFPATHKIQSPSPRSAGRGRG